MSLPCMLRIYTHTQQQASERETFAFESIYSRGIYRCSVPSVNNRNLRDFSSSERSAINAIFYMSFADGVPFALQKYCIFAIPARGKHKIGRNDLLVCANVDIQKKAEAAVWQPLLF